MKEVVIVSAVRSAVGKGKKDGALANVHAVDLSAHMMKAAIERAGIDPATIDDVFWGCAMPEATQGLNVARLVVAARRACRSKCRRRRSTASARRGCRRVALGAQEIMSGMADVVLAGGVEMMSQVPMSGYHTRLDPEITESYIGMGFTAERVAERWKVTREDQDRWAFGSQQKAARALSNGAFDDADRSRSGGARDVEGRREARVDDGLRARRAAARRHDASKDSPSCGRRSRQTAR